MPVVMPEKYKPATLPSTHEQALEWADERTEWARQARERDQPGTAREFELTALLLRFFAGAMERSNE